MSYLDPDETPLKQNPYRPLNEAFGATSFFIGAFYSPRFRQDSRRMICGGLHNLIDECTVILGWCYTSDQVEQTKRKQEGLMQEALQKIFPDFDVKVGGMKHALRSPNKGSQYTILPTRYYTVVVSENGNASRFQHAD